MKLSFKIIGYGGWKLFWQLMRKWLSEKFEGVSAAIANIDLSPISNKVDEVKSDVADVKADVADVKTDVADVKTAVENINVESADNLAQFFGIVKDGDTVKVVTEDGGEEVVEPVGLMDEDDVYDYLEDIAVLMGGITAQQAASITAATRAIIHGGSGSGEGGEGGSGSGSGE